MDAYLIPSGMASAVLLGNTLFWKLRALNWTGKLRPGGGPFLPS